MLPLHHHLSRPFYAQILRALCACAALVCCLCTTGCFTMAVQDKIAAQNRPVAHHGEFWVQEIFIDKNVSFEDFINLPIKDDFQNFGIPRIVLGGNWRLTDGDDKAKKYGYIMIEKTNWKRYVSFCKANNQELSLSGILEYDNALRKKDAKENCVATSPNYCYDVIEDNSLSSSGHSITDKFPANSNGIRIPLKEEYKRTSNFAAIPSMFLTVPLDIVTSPFQLVLITYELFVPLEGE
jgi:hypothetical protein